MSISGSPRLIKGGIVLLDPDSGAMLRVIALQYNPDTVSRSLIAQTVAAEGPNRSEPLRLKGPPIETFKLEAELDATDQLEFQNQTAAQVGLLPQLAVLETIVYPSSQTILANHALAQAGTLEIAPMEAPLALFVWSSNRIVPVRGVEPVQHQLIDMQRELDQGSTQSRVSAAASGRFIFNPSISAACFRCAMPTLASASAARKAAVNATLRIVPPENCSRASLSGRSPSVGVWGGNICCQMRSRSLASGNGNCTIVRSRRTNAGSSASSWLVVRIASPR